MDEEIFLTKCYRCGKRIAVKVPKCKCSHGAYSCNDCVPKNNGVRNGIEEALETDLFDEIDDKYYKEL